MDRYLICLLFGFACGIAVELLARIISTRRTVYGYFDLSEEKEDVLYEAKMSVKEEDLLSIPKKRRLVLKIRTKNDAFYGNE